MVKLLLIINTLLTLPFGIAALIAPVAVFTQFGVKLDPGGALVARGYAATLVGYGLMLWQMRRSPEAKVAKPLLVSLIVFNLIETVVQGIAGVQSVALPVIFANVALHGLVCAACAYAYFKQV